MVSRRAWRERRLLPSLALGGTVLALWRKRRRSSSGLDSPDAQLRTILDFLPVVVMLRAADGRLLHVNPAGEHFAARLGVGVDHLSPSASSLMDHVEVIHEDGRPYDPAELPVVRAIRDGTSNEATVGHALLEGGYAWYSVRAAPIPLADGSMGTVVTCDDVTERHEAWRRVEVAERALRSTFDHAPIGIAVVDTGGRVMQVNAALCDLLGYSEEYLLAKGLGALTLPDERVGEHEQLERWLSEPQEQGLVERHFRHASGRVVFTQLSVAGVRSADGSSLHHIIQFVDLSDRRALEHELREAALKDPLTGLANRRVLAESLTRAQQLRARLGGDIGLLYVDLDRFKQVNDTHGHDVGDRVLVEVGQRLLAMTREVDTVCRVGGDEFVVLCASVDGQRGLDDVVARLDAMAPVVVPLAGQEVAVAASVGAILVDPDDDLEVALRRADRAMYRAKRLDSPVGPSAVG